MINILLNLNYGCSKIEFSKKNKFYRLNKPSTMFKNFISKTKHEEFIIRKDNQLHSINGPAYWCASCNIKKYFFKGQQFNKDEWEHIIKKSMDK